MSRILTLAVAVTVAGCSSADAETSQSSEQDQTVAAPAHARSLSFEAVKVQTMNTPTSTGDGGFVRRPVLRFSEVATRDEAEREAPAFLATSEEQALVACASDFGVKRGAVFGRFEGCRTLAVEDTQPTPPLFRSAFQCDLGVCARSNPAAAEVVLFDGSSAHLTTASGALLHAGTKVIVIADLNKLGDFVSSERIELGPHGAGSGVIAVAPHIFVRAGDGTAFEVPGLPRLDPQVGFDLDGNGFAFTVPSGTQSIEMFVKWERFAYVTTFAEDGSFTRTLKSRAADAYVSNFGKNFGFAVR